MNKEQTPDAIRELKNELRPITAPFRAGRLIIGLFVLLFAGIFALGFIEQILKGPNDSVSSYSRKNR
jgi:hypothetical protein